MKIWPSDKFEIETTMSLQDVVDVLKSKTEPKKLFRLSSHHSLFQGDITQDDFHITRIIHYRNSFLPIVTGKFLLGTSGTKVAIRLGLHPLVTLFMCVWFGGIGLGVVGAFAGFKSGQATAPVILVPFALLVFGVALVSGGFWFEARKQKPMLIEMFKGSKPSDQSH